MLAAKPLEISEDTLLHEHKANVFGVEWARQKKR